MSQDAITIDQVREFAAAWFLALDQHVPIEQAYSFLADDGLNMHFPEGDIRDFSSFKQWYARVTNLFFDEDHYLHSVEGTVSGDRAELRVVVAWQASWFEPPEAKSRRTSMNATHDWTVGRSGKNAFGVGDCQLQHDCRAVCLRAGLRPHLTARPLEEPEDIVDNVPDTALGRMYRDHIQLVFDKNIEALFDQYTDGALLN